jgi:hypothetical protein
MPIIAQSGYKVKAPQQHNTAALTVITKDLRQISISSISSRLMASLVPLIQLGRARRLVGRNRLFMFNYTTIVQALATTLSFRPPHDMIYRYGRSPGARSAIRTAVSVV